MVNSEAALSTTETEPSPEILGARTGIAGSQGVAANQFEQLIPGEALLAKPTSVEEVFAKVKEKKDLLWGPDGRPPINEPHPEYEPTIDFDGGLISDVGPDNLTGPFISFMNEHPEGFETLLKGERPPDLGEAGDDLNLVTKNIVRFLDEKSDKSYEYVSKSVDLLTEGSKVIALYAARQKLKDAGPYTTLQMIQDLSTGIYQILGGEVSKTTRENSQQQRVVDRLANLSELQRELLGTAAVSTAVTVGFVAAEAYDAPSVALAAGATVGGALVKTASMNKAKEFQEQLEERHVPNDPRTREFFDYVEELIQEEGIDEDTAEAMREEVRERDAIDNLRLEQDAAFLGLLKAGEWFYDADLNDVSSEKLVKFIDAAFDIQRSHMIKRYGIRESAGSDRLRGRVGEAVGDLAGELGGPVGPVLQDGIESVVKMGETEEPEKE